MLASSSSDPDTGDILVVDPLTDLFFVIAILFLILIASLIPTLSKTFSSVHSDSGSMSAFSFSRSFVRDGKAYAPLFALADGVRYGPEGREMVPLSELSRDRTFFEFLRNSQESPIVVLVSQEGGETAFTLESALYQAGVNEIQTIHLEADCYFAKTLRARTLCQREGVR